MKPSARAQALGAPVEVPLASIQPGEMVRVLWRGRLVFVLRRSDEMLARLPDTAGELRLERLMDIDERERIQKHMDHYHICGCLDESVECCDPLCCPPPNNIINFPTSQEEDE